MPRFNMFAIWIVALVSSFCYQQVEHRRESIFLTEAIDTIRDEGLEDVSRQELFNAAMSGMTERLDRFSRFIPRDQKELFEQQVENHFPGIGIRIRRRPNEQTQEIELFVEDTVIGNPRPAHDAGLRSGDRIVAVNGQVIVGKEQVGEGEIPVSESINHIKGPAGTKVDITVLRDGKRQTFAVTRQEIDVDTVLGDTRDAEGKWEFDYAADPRIGYIRIDSFSERTLGDLNKALEMLQEKKAIQGLIIDLRDNPGGYLSTTVEMCRRFIDDSHFDGLIVSTRDRFGKDHDVYRATGDGALTRFPMVVMVNGESASASEIFSACLQDHKRAIVCGTRSYGKGSVQKMIPMERGRSILKLTTNSFWRPSGRQIHRMEDDTDEDEWGVLPDDGFVVPLTDEENERRLKERNERDIAEIESTGALPTDPLFDPQLAKAVEYLQNQLETKSE